MPARAASAEREAAHRGHDPEQHRGDADDRRDRPPEAVQLARQRRLQRIDGVDQRRDPPHLGVRARRDRDAESRPRRDDGAGVQHAVALRQRRLRRCGTGLLVDRCRFTGEHRLLRAQPLGVEQPHVRAHTVALRHGQDVAGHDELGRDLDPGVVAADERGLGHEVREGGDRAPGAVLLEEADDRVEDDDGQHDRRVLQLPERGRGRRRQQRARTSAGCEPGRGAARRPTAPPPAATGSARARPGAPAPLRSLSPVEFDSSASQGVLAAAGVPLAGWGRRASPPAEEQVGRSRVRPVVVIRHADAREHVVGAVAVGVAAHGRRGDEAAGRRCRSTTGWARRSRRSDIPPRARGGPAGRSPPTAVRRRRRGSRARAAPRRRSRSPPTRPADATAKPAQSDPDPAELDPARAQRAEIDVARRARRPKTTKAPPPAVLNGVRLPCGAPMIEVRQPVAVDVAASVDRVSGFAHPGHGPST